jgi:hypothetical protein
MARTSEIRGAGLLGPWAAAEYKELEPGQGVTFVREPDNRKDPCAVIVVTADTRQPCGYLARQDAAWLSQELADGVRWYGIVTAKGCAGRWAKINLKKMR